MGFSNTSYESDAGFVCSLRASDAEIAAMTLSTSAVDAGFHAINSGSVRRFGVHPRGFVLTRERGTAPDTFSSTTFLAAPTAAGFDSVAQGATISIGGVDWEVLRKRPEILT